MRQGLVVRLLVCVCVTITFLRVFAVSFDSVFSSLGGARFSTTAIAILFFPLRLASSGWRYYPVRRKLVHHEITRLHTIRFVFLLILSASFNRDKHTQQNRKKKRRLLILHCADSFFARGLSSLFH